MAKSRNKKPVKDVMLEVSSPRLCQYIRMGLFNIPKLLLGGFAKLSRLC
jgi:hypothetical protein